MAIGCIGFSLVFRLDGAFFLHGYWKHFADRIIYFLQYINFAEINFSLPYSLYSNELRDSVFWHPISYMRLVNFAVFESVFGIRYVQKTNLHNLISTYAEYMKPRNEKYVVLGPSLKSFNFKNWTLY